MGYIITGRWPGVGSFRAKVVGWGGVLGTLYNCRLDGGAIQYFHISLFLVFFISFL